jgi:tRNA threonylcarbamoyl adenosine modification protein YeaZ
MLTLALDTATRTLSVALVNDQMVLAEASEIAAQSHAERLPILLEQLLNKTGKHRSEITLVAVGVGPGAYTGLRVGLMFATTFARAINAELVGICTHDAIAPAHYSGLVITDARRKEVYLSRYANGNRISSPIVSKPDRIELTDASVIGDGVAVFPEIFPTGKNIAISAGRLGQLVNAAIALGEKPAAVVPKLSASAENGADALPAGIGLLLPPFPLYLRRPDVAEPK